MQMFTDLNKPLAWIHSYSLFNDLNTTGSLPTQVSCWDMTVSNWVQGGCGRQGGADASECRAASSC